MLAGGHPKLFRIRKAVTSNRPSPSDETSRVVPFRQRGTPRWRWPVQRQRPGESPVDDLTKFERGEDADDYRHRMKMNFLAVFVTLVLIALGLWIADMVADFARTQDCFMTGRRDCAPIKVPSQIGRAHV